MYKLASFPCRLVDGGQPGMSLARLINVQIGFCIIAALIQHKNNYGPRYKTEIYIVTCNI